MNQYILYFATLFFLGSAMAQQPSDYAKMIDVEDLENYITRLASDGFEGRETGRKGQKKAADFIVDYYKAIGTSPGNNDSYYQHFKIAQVVLGGTIDINGVSLQYGKDFIPMFFNYAFEKVFEKVKMIDDCDDIKGNMENVLLIVDDQDCKKSVNDIYKAARKKDVGGLIFISDDFKKYESELKNFHGRAYLIKDTSFTEIQKNNPPLILVNPKSFSFESEDSEKVKLDINTIEILEGENLPTIIEGSDPELKKEYVVLTAHYDHLGISGDLVFNGADDNGTGTAGLMEIAEAFMKAKEEGHGPKRSIMIMPVAGEEKGLLGSQYYVNNPTIPLDDIITDLNIDMIGRVDENHKDEPNYIYLIGSDRLSQELHEISEEMNKEFTKFTIDYTYNEKNDPNRYYYRSDHYNFAKNGIPSIFYFSGVHEDYHKSTDTVDKIDFERVAKVTRLVFYTAWELANRATRPKVD